RSSLATTTSSFVLSSRRRHTRCYRDLSSDVCSSDLDDSVTPAGGDPIGAKTVVWSAGVRPTDPAGGESPRSGSHRLETDQYLRLKEQPDVYVIGDAASVSTPEGGLAMRSPPAMEEGRGRGGSPTGLGTRSRDL